MGVKYGLGGAERQTRYRLRLAVALKQPPGRGHNPTGARGAIAATPLPTQRKTPRGPSLSQRWDDTAAGPVGLRADDVRWLEATPEATRDTLTGEALQAMAELDRAEIMEIRPPRGFGRD